MNTPEHPEPKSWWRHVRRMAYAGAAGMLLYPFLALAMEPETVRAVTPPFYLGCAAMVGAFAGFGTLSEVKLSGRGT